VVTDRSESGPYLARPYLARPCCLAWRVRNGRGMDAPAGFTRRRALPHDIPSWVAADAIYFVTVCATPRGRNQLCQASVADKLVATLRHYEARGRWLILAYVLMPDHLHVVMSGADPRKIVGSWKRYVARHLHIRWQRDFFEHRLRHREAVDEKIDYVRHNPVRSGLVHTPDEWPHLWVRGPGPR
jgi:putative transposase